MKIGILTFHRAINYGAVLQCYALTEILKQLGHEVCVIDYRQPRVERTDRRVCSKKEKRKLLLGFHLRSWFFYDSSWKRHIEEEQRFDNFLANYFSLSTPCDADTIPQSYDTYIVGSDQIWNSVICDGIDRVYWGQFKKPLHAKLISYAASTSVSNLLSNDLKRLYNYLSVFSCISVREKKVADFLNQRMSFSKKVETVLDPTLLANKSIWDKMDTQKYDFGEYVLYFAARSSATRPNAIEIKARKLAQKMNCKILPIRFGLDSPEQFVMKFKYAKAVVTSSFHGVVFSLIFNKMLYAVKNGDEQDARYVDLLKSIGADYMLSDVNIDSEIPYRADYKTINENLEQLRKKSMLFLKSI